MFLWLKVRSIDVKVTWDFCFRSLWGSIHPKTRKWRHFLMRILITKRTPAAPWRCRNACVVHAGLISLGGAPGARAMQLRWLTSDRKWHFWWLRSRANPKPRKCDMASAWGERHRRRAPDFTSQSAGFRTQTTRECRRRRGFLTPLPETTTTLTGPPPAAGPLVVVVVGAVAARGGARRARRRF